MIAPENAVVEEEEDDPNDPLSKTIASIYSLPYKEVQSMASVRTLPANARKYDMARLIAFNDAGLAGDKERLLAELRAQRRMARFRARSAQGAQGTPRRGSFVTAEADSASFSQDDDDVFGPSCEDDQDEDYAPSKAKKARSSFGAVGGRSSPAVKQAAQQAARRFSHELVTSTACAPATVTSTSERPGLGLGPAAAAASSGTSSATSALDLPALIPMGMPSGTLAHGPLSGPARSSSMGMLPPPSDMSPLLHHQGVSSGLTSPSLTPNRGGRSAVRGQGRQQQAVKRSYSAGPGVKARGSKTMPGMAFYRPPAPLHGRHPRMDGGGILYKVPSSLDYYPHYSVKESSFQSSPLSRSPVPGSLMHSSTSSYVFENSTDVQHCLRKDSNVMDNAHQKSSLEKFYTVKPESLQMPIQLSPYWKPANTSSVDYYTTPISFASSSALPFGTSSMAKQLFYPTPSSSSMYAASFNQPNYHHNYYGMKSNLTSFGYPPNIELMPPQVYGHAEHQAPNHTLQESSASNLQYFTQPSPHHNIEFSGRNPWQGQEKWSNAQYQPCPSENFVSSHVQDKSIFPQYKYMEASNQEEEISRNSSLKSQHQMRHQEIFVDHKFSHQSPQSCQEQDYSVQGPLKNQGSSQNPSIVQHSSFHASQHHQVDSVGFYNPDFRGHNNQISLPLIYDYLQSAEKQVSLLQNKQEEVPPVLHASFTQCAPPLVVEEEILPTLPGDVTNCRDQDISQHEDVSLRVTNSMNSSLDGVANSSCISVMGSDIQSLPREEAVGKNSSLNEDIVLYPNPNSAELSIAPFSPVLSFDSRAVPDETPQQHSACLTESSHRDAHVAGSQEVAEVTSFDSQVVPNETQIGGNPGEDKSAQASSCVSAVFVPSEKQTTLIPREMTSTLEKVSQDQNCNEVVFACNTGSGELEYMTLQVSQDDSVNQESLPEKSLPEISLPEKSLSCSDALDRTTEVKDDVLNNSGSLPGTLPASPNVSYGMDESQEAAINLSSTVPQAQDTSSHPSMASTIPLTNSSVSTFKRSSIGDFLSSDTSEQVPISKLKGMPEASLSSVKESELQSDEARSNCFVVLNQMDVDMTQPKNLMSGPTETKDSVMSDSSSSQPASPYSEVDTTNKNLDGSPSSGSAEDGESNPSGTMSKSTDSSNCEDQGRSSNSSHLQTRSGSGRALRSVLAPKRKLASRSESPLSQLAKGRRPCPNADNGCVLELPPAQLTSHVLVCEYSLVKCPVASCDWNNVAKKLCAHIREAHRQDVKQGNDSQHTISVEQMHYEQHLSFLREVSRKLFVVRIHYHCEKIYAVIQYIAAGRSDKPVFATGTLEFIDNSGAPQAWRGRICPIQQDFTSVRSSGNCLQVNLENEGATIDSTITFYANIRVNQPHGQVL